MSRISVIIPVYNAAKGLVSCLDSLIAQTHTDFEVLLVDDGSTDESPAICERYCADDTRFRLITQENAGPSAARNRGIAEAQGEYLAFMDSDDFLEPHALATFHEAAETSKADITVCGYYIDKKGSLTQQTLRYAPGVYHGDDCRKMAIEAIDIHSKTVLPPYSWVRCVRRSFLQGTGLTFDPTLRRSEDYFFWLQVHFHADTVCLIGDQPLYHYIDNDESITHNYLKNYWGMSRSIYERLCELLPKDPLITARLENMYVHRSLIALNNAAFSKDEHVFRADMDEILKDHKLRHIIRRWRISTGWKNHRVFYLLLKLHLYGFVRARYAKKHAQHLARN